MDLLEESRRGCRATHAYISSCARGAEIVGFDRRMNGTLRRIPHETVRSEATATTVSERRRLAFLFVLHPSRVGVAERNRRRGEHASMTRRGGHASGLVVVFRFASQGNTAAVSVLDLGWYEGFRLAGSVPRGSFPPEGIVERMDARERKTERKGKDLFVARDRRCDGWFVRRGFYESELHLRGKGRGGIDVGWKHEDETVGRPTIPFGGAEAMARREGFS